MKKLVFIAMIALLLISACSVNEVRPEVDQAREQYSGLTTKVGILPLKSLDAASRNINRILTVRDLDYFFATHPQYQLLSM